MTPENDFAALEAEFADKCEGYEGRCTNQATWMVWYAHATRGCPSTFRMCDRCKLQSVGLIMQALKGEYHCGACKANFEGDIDDHVRDVPL